MSFRRWAAVLLAVAGSLLVAAVLYISLGGLGRHKARVEALVSGPDRPAFRDRRSVSRSGCCLDQGARGARAPRKRAPWGSSPQMVEIGHFSTEIRLWSLRLGAGRDPLDRGWPTSPVLLEEGPDGKGNWVRRQARAPPAEEPETARPETTQIPAVVDERAALRATCGSPIARKRRPSASRQLDSLTIGPDLPTCSRCRGKAAGRLRSRGERRARPAGRAQFPGATSASLSRPRSASCAWTRGGGIGRLNPARRPGRDLKLAHPDIGAMLKKLNLPAVASGACRRYGAAERRRRGDRRIVSRRRSATSRRRWTERYARSACRARISRFAASLADLARPRGGFRRAWPARRRSELGGHVVSTRTEIKLDGFDARYAGVRAKADRR